MKDHGVSAVKVATLKYDAADIQRRQKMPHVIELAASIASLGGKPLAPIVIQKKTRVLLAGRDRVAAMLVNGATTIDARQVDADAKEASRIERHENLHRRPVDRDKLIAEEIAAETKTIETAKAAAPKVEAPKGDLADKKSGKSKSPAKPMGRPKTAKGEAREQIAKKLGTSPEAVRAAEKREAKAEKAKAAPPPAAPAIAIDMLGLVATSDFVEMVADVTAGLDAIERNLKAAQGSVTRMEQTVAVGEVEAGAMPRLKSLLHDAASLVRGLQPKCVCPYCKDPDGEAKRRESCSGCDGRGYLSESKSTGIPPELLIVGEHAMVSDGRTGFVPLAQAA